MLNTSKNLQEKRLGEEKQQKEQREQGQAERWNRVYVGLTSDQQVKS